MFLFKVGLLMVRWYARHNMLLRFGDTVIYILHRCVTNLKSAYAGTTANIYIGETSSRGTKIPLLHTLVQNCLMFTQGSRMPYARPRWPGEPTSPLRGAYVAPGSNLRCPFGFYCASFGCRGGPFSLILICTAVLPPPRTEPGGLS